MRTACLLLAMLGLAGILGRTCDEPDSIGHPPDPFDNHYGPPEPYYVSAGLNGNEVYPPVTGANPQRSGEPDQPGQSSTRAPSGRARGRGSAADFACDLTPPKTFEHR